MLRLPRRALGLLALSLVVAVLLLTTIRYEHPPFGIQDLLSRLRPFQESSPNSHRTNKMSQPVKRTAAVIFSHGLGDSSAGWSFLAEQLGSVLPWVNCFPDAPLQPVTLNMGAKMQSWFDILGLRPDAPEDEKGLLESVKTIQSLGGAISILTGLMSPSPLAGVACLSGFLTLKDKIKQLQGPHASQLNVFWGHGTSDPVVQYQWGSKSVDFLKEELGLTNVDFKSYPDLVHSASPLELKQLSEWLLTRLPNQ
ncbi:hypothetical protein Pst134EA_024680 [Puccinia striiformis f. sp. tritici]|uniref:hypothetical protein n=1 Tax=Puccinia striiformis f. sp. tritici TaxID=168172 RepID=UPI0020075F35|nr:hypothetical protein Pst134EA_024680 [Puccinia striiformis f. sp. tritici]KAH9453814.1 hypothetical protein Pst134EA_024680 [Puccinia striiformis f. sp. tritici]